jgi:response regulator NasT
MHTALVCDRDIRTRESLKAALLQLGISEVLVCNQRDNALELAHDHRPDLLIVEAALPLDGLQLITTIRAQYAPLVVLLLEQGGLKLLKQATEGLIDAFLAKPLPAAGLVLTIELALHAGQQMARLRDSCETAQTALKQRKQIEKAKGLLMDREQMGEEQAFKKMRSLAMARRVTLTRLAEEIIREGQH